jgi:predicted  nucleic acid-binding Zn-ribbon protein
VFERLRTAINAALDAARSPADPRAVASQMREAVIEARASLEAMKQGIGATERRLAAERQQLEDAERRGRLAAGIDDAETVRVAEEFATRHRERVTVLEGKLAAQQAELELAQREYDDMKAQLVTAERDRPADDARRSVEAAWRSIEIAGGTRPETDVGDDLLRSSLDRAAREAAAEAQLEELKKRMGR